MGLQAPASSRDSLSCSSCSFRPRQGLGKGFVPFEKLKSSSNRRKRSLARATDSTTVRAVVASAEEEVQVVAPEDVLAVESKQRQNRERVGVLLLNLGGPDTLEDVQPFLYNLFADPVNCALCTFL